MNVEVQNKKDQWCCCVCGNMNYPHRRRCHLNVCNAPYGFPGPYNGANDKSQVKIALTSSIEAWECPACGNFNRATRERCHREQCQQPKPISGVMPMHSGAWGREGQPGGAPTFHYPQEMQPLPQYSSSFPFPLTAVQVSAARSNANMSIAPPLYFNPSLQQQGFNQPPPTVTLIYKGTEQGGDGQQLIQFQQIPLPVNKWPPFPNGTHPE